LLKEAQQLLLLERESRLMRQTKGMVFPWKWQCLQFKDTGEAWL